MTDELKNVIIGLFVASAAMIIVFIILFLHPSTGNEEQALYVRFADIDKINIGTRVTLAGKPIGEVAEIKLVEPGRQGVADQLGHLYLYELKLLIDSHIKVYENDEIVAHTSGLLGEKSINIIPVALKHGEVALLVKKGQIMYATESLSVEDALNEVRGVAERLDMALESMHVILEDIVQKEIVKKVGTLFDNLVDITQAIDKPEQLAAIMNNVQSATDNVHHVTAQVAARLLPTWNTVDETMGQFHQSASNVRHLTDTADRVVQNMSKGQGTAGKIIVSDDLYLRLVSILNKGEVVMDDINHYGLLFQLDKGWQRLRARRINLMQKLSSPQEFQNFFNDEVDKITTSLSRVSMVLNTSGSSYPQYLFLDDQEFSKVFADLLRRVSGMEDSLKMYNTQRVDYERSKTQLCPERE